MKKICAFVSEKYRASSYQEIEPDIFFRDGKYCLSIQFQQEPELGEGCDATDISQYPLEDLLDRFGVYVSDFYTEINARSGQKCHLELASGSIRNIRELKSIIGRRVYNRAFDKGGEDYAELIIE